MSARAERVSPDSLAPERFVDWVSGPASMPRIYRIGGNAWQEDIIAAWLRWQGRQRARVFLGSISFDADGRDQWVSVRLGNKHWITLYVQRTNELSELFSGITRGAAGVLVSEFMVGRHRDRVESDSQFGLLIRSSEETIALPGEDVSRGGGL